MLCGDLSVATLYHYAFGWHAPYPLLQRAGAARHRSVASALLIGPAGLLHADSGAATDADRPVAPPAWTPLSLLMLLLDQRHRLPLLLLRDTAAMGILLALHLGVVLGAVSSLPYGKFVHGLYRFLALMKYAAERKNAVFIE